MNIYIISIFLILIPHKSLLCGTSPLETKKMGIKKAFEESRTLWRGVYTAPSRIPEAGNGLFASIDFSTGEYITEYSGERIQLSLKEKEIRMSNPELWSHTFSLSQYSCISGLNKPSFGDGCGSFTNHHPTKANAKFVKLCDKSGLEFCFLQATKFIAPGEEIYTNYGNDYIDRLSDQNSDFHEKVIGKYFFGKNEQWIKRKAANQEYTTIAKFFNQIKKPLPNWPELNYNPEAWSDELCKIGLYRYNVINESELDEKTFASYKTNSPRYHKAIIWYLLYRSRNAKDKSNLDDTTLHTKLTYNARTNNLPPPTGFKKEGKYTAVWQDSVVNLLLWIFAPQFFFQGSKSNTFKTLAESIDSESHPEDYEQLILQYFLSFLPKESHKPGSTIKKADLRSLMRRIQVGDNQLPLPKIVSGSDFSHEKKWHIESVKEFLKRKGYGFEFSSRNGQIPFWEKLHDSYKPSSPDNYLKQFSEKAKDYNYDFHKMFDKAYKQMAKSPLFFPPIDNVKKDSLTYGIRTSSNAHLECIQNKYCNFSYQALFQYIHNNGLNREIVESMTLNDAYSLAGMVQEGYNNAFLGNRNEAFQTFLAIGISREKAQESKKTKLVHLKRIGERINLPHLLLSTGSFEKEILGNPTEDDFYNELYNTLLKKGKEIRHRYSNKKRKGKENTRNTKKMKY
jgi:hypothetical protein